MDLTAMRTKNEIKFLTKLLNIEGIKVISHRQHEGIGIILQLEQIGKESSCPRCGTKSHRLHQNHRTSVKDLPWGENFVFLEINRRQFKCEKCGKPFSEELEFVRKRRSYTKRLARKIIQEVLENDIHSVAKKGVVTTEEIERMLKDAAKEYLKAKPLGSFDWMGIGSGADASGPGGVAVGNVVSFVGCVGGVSPISDAVGVVASDTTNGGACTPVFMCVSLLRRRA
ncbi:transposase family protein [Microcoleus sp. S13_C5]